MPTAFWVTLDSDLICCCAKQRNATVNFVLDDPAAVLIPRIVANRTTFGVQGNFVSVQLSPACLLCFLGHSLSFLRTAADACANRDSYCESQVPTPGLCAANFTILQTYKVQRPQVTTPKQTSYPIVTLIFGSLDLRGKLKSCSALSGSLAPRLSCRFGFEIDCM
jgi:hypothetical protein